MLITGGGAPFSGSSGYRGILLELVTGGCGVAVVVVENDPEHRVAQLFVEAGQSHPEDLLLLLSGRGSRGRRSGGLPPVLEDAPRDLAGLDCVAQPLHVGAALLRGLGGRSRRRGAGTCPVFHSDLIIFFSSFFFSIFSYRENAARQKFLENYFFLGKQKINTTTASMLFLLLTLLVLLLPGLLSLVY